MQPTFAIDVDTSRHIIHIVMAGFFAPEDIARFRYARGLALERLTCGPNEHLTLIDIRGMQIQSQETVASFSQLFQERLHASKAVAFVVSRSLARLQAQRAAAGRNVAYFIDDVAAAERWLLEA